MMKANVIRRLVGLLGHAKASVQSNVVETVITLVAFGE